MLLIHYVVVTGSTIYLVGTYLQHDVNVIFPPAIFNKIYQYKSPKYFFLDIE